MTDDTQNPGGWPDPARPGVPLNPERDGWQIVRHKGNGAFVPRYWERDHWHAGVGVRWPSVPPDEAARMWDYAGPMLTPAEVAAREAAAAEAMREACAKRMAHMPANRWDGDPCQMIRTLPLPAPDALARALDEARREGMLEAAAALNGVSGVMPNTAAAGIEAAKITIRAAAERITP